MTEPTSLAALLGQRVTVTGPNGSKWAGTLTALADQPTAVIDLPDGGRVSLPQSHTYTVAPRPEDELREQLAAATARAEQAEYLADRATQRARRYMEAWSRALDRESVERAGRVTAEARIAAVRAEVAAPTDNGRKHGKTLAGQLAARVLAALDGPADTTAARLEGK